MSISPKQLVYNAMNDAFTLVKFIEDKNLLSGEDWKELIDKAGTLSSKYSKLDEKSAEYGRKIISETIGFIEAQQRDLKSFLEGGDENV